MGCFIAAVAAIVLAISASSASALRGPSALSVGFDGDTLVFRDGQPSIWFPRMERIGSTWVRIPGVWNTIAPRSRPPGFRPGDPGDPHYDWGYLDRAVRAATASHQHVLLMLVTPPSWALGPRPPRSPWPYTWRPDARAYGEFTHAVAQRYSGHFPDPADPRQTLPLVDHFQAWNEPNLPSQLAPQWTRAGRQWVPASPTIYRGLLNAAYANIKLAQPRAYVLAAGLGPYGDAPGVQFGRMRPVQFLRELLCLRGPRLRPQRCNAPAHLDAIDIHPYSFTPTAHAYNPDDVSVPDVRKLSRVLGAAQRARRVVPGGSKPIWMTEIAWDTSPPDPNGIPLDRQARYVSLTAYELWLQGVSHVFWYEAPDLGVPAGNFTGAGIFFGNGLAKPSAAAFRFPFVAIRGARGKVTLWGRAPRAGVVAIEVMRQHRWRQATRLTTTRGGVFGASPRLGSHLTVRARIGGVASAAFSTG